MASGRPVLYLLLDFPGTDRLEELKPFLARLEGAWSSIDLVQARAKEAPAGAYVEILTAVREAVRVESGDEPAMRPGERGLERGGGARPLVLANDRLDVALAAGADGVHVGAEDPQPQDLRVLPLPDGFVIGLTCHTAEELARAPGSGADYAAVGAFFPSPTKPGPLPDPRPALRDLDAAYPLPLYAIGGLTLQRLDEVLTFPQIRGVVVSSAIQRAAVPVQASRTWRARLNTFSPRP